MPLSDNATLDGDEDHQFATCNIRLDSLHFSRQQLLIMTRAYKS